MDEGTGAIRQEIEDTRRRVGDEVEALSYKTDVGARLDDYVDEKKESVRSTVTSAKDGVVSAVDSAIPGSGPPSKRLKALTRTAERNPQGMQRLATRLAAVDEPTRNELVALCFRTHQRYAKLGEASRTGATLLAHRDELALNELR